MRQWLTSFCILCSWLLLASGCTSPKDCGFVQNVRGERISWKGQLPIRLKVHESVPESYFDEIKAAIQVWNQQADKTLFILDETKVMSSSRKAARDKTNVIYYYNHWEREKAFEQARTSVYWKGDEIDEADIRLNGFNFKFYSDDPRRKLAREEDLTAGHVHLKSLIVHELGHVLGLRHNDKEPSVMATHLNSNSVRTALNVTDKDALSCEY